MECVPHRTLNLVSATATKGAEAVSPRAIRRFVAYCRVSTDRQGRSGFGLEAQQKAVMDYLNGGAWELVGEFVEVESGKKSNRPEMARAIDACRKHKARLVIAKLDRLSRNLAFVATLMDSGVEFVAVDNPKRQQADHPHPGGRRRTRARSDFRAYQGSPRGRQGAWEAVTYAGPCRLAYSRASKLRACVLAFGQGAFGEGEFGGDEQMVVELDNGDNLEQTFGTARPLHQDFLGISAAW
jgi:hypothetical protein